MLDSIESFRAAELHNLVLAFIDTNSTLAAALAAAEFHIPITQVEVGLRSFNRRMPAGINKIVTDHPSASVFAPTEIAVSNLRREGISKNAIVRTGDVMYDAALFYDVKARAKVRSWRKAIVDLGNFVLATV